MSVNGSTNSLAFKSNVKLCRAIEKQSILYDPNHEYYRKRLPSENCWDMVASETGVSVDKCKRRWRQIRTDYIRWMNTDNHRHRNGLKRPTFYLTDDLKFLKPHLTLSDLSERDKESVERERDSKSKGKEMSSEDGYKDTEKDASEAIEEQPLSKLKQSAKTQSERDNAKEKEKENLKEEGTAKEAEKPKQAEKSKKEEAESKHKEEDRGDEDINSEEEEESSSRTDDKELSEDRGTSSNSDIAPITVGSANISVKKPEFFIKQSNKASPNCLIIGKKPLDPAPVLAVDSFEQMADDCADETASVGEGRRLRRMPARIKQLAIQKTVSEQRLTRLQRRKSMCIAVANSLRSSTSPVKMTPLPRVSLGTTTTTTKIQPKAPAKPTTPKSTAVSPRDDIFPRPRSTAPVSQQLVLARRPGPAPGPVPVPVQQQNPTPQSFPVRQYSGVGRPPGSARLAVGPAKRPFAVPAVPILRAPAPSTVDSLKMPPASSSSSSSPPLHRLVSSSNTLVISTTSCPVISHNTTTNSSSSSSLSTITASITASPIVSTTPPVMAVVKRGERSTQTESYDIYSDDYFLDMVRPQMLEMNPRQKMHFKQKIFQALMETFDDATDFPNSGEVQHFNINTPSGFENVSDPELRLVRELVSMVSAAKLSELGSPPTAVPAVAARVAGRGGISKTPQRGLRQSLVTPGGAGSPAEEDKKLYRILPMGNNTKILPGGYALPTSMADMRKDSIDSNSSARTAPGGRATFLVPSNSPKTPRLVDPLTSLFATGPATVGGATKVSPGIAMAASVTKEPILVRQMGRRYSVCGGGGSGPSTALASPAGASSSGSSQANAIQLETLLKRRLANPSQSMVPPQQRPRYSHSPQSHTVAAGLVGAIAPGNSLLVRRAAANGAQKQLSPPGGGSVPQKTPQISNIQGGSFNAFATPNSVRGNNSIASSSSTPPLKRGMVIANVKGNTQQKSSVSAVHPGPQPGTASLRGKSTSSPNVANLLGESRAQKPAQSRSKTPSLTQPQSPSQPASFAEQTEHGGTETAGVIAADYFDMSRLKREPQDIMDDDILGM